MGSSVFPNVQESIRIGLPMTTAMVCPSSPGRLPVSSSDSLWTRSHVFSEVKCASSSLSLCFVLRFCLWLWLSLCYLLVLRERHWQFVHVLREDYVQTLSRPAQPCVCLYRGKHGIDSEISVSFLITHLPSRTAQKRLSVL